MAEEWRQKALTEIKAIKPAWADKYGWNPEVREQDGWIDLFVGLRRRATSTRPLGRFVLRLRYQSDFETAGRREAFVNPENLADEGPQFWPSGVRGFNPANSPPTICLEGTWGFHSFHHRERDGRRANVNRLLLEIQKCLNE